MASRSKAMLKNLLPKIKGEGVSAEAIAAWRKALPKNKCVMGRAKRGLYGGRHIQFGNNISEDGGNKTRRTWKPNVQEKRLFSLILDRYIRIKVTTHTLRCIDKAGCIDDYLLQMPVRKLENELALFWKVKIQQQYEKLSKMEVGFFPPEEEKKLEEAFERVKIARKASRAENREKNRLNANTEMNNGAEGGIQDAMLDRREGTESDVADDGQRLGDFQSQPT
jgi:large subunit ribosomal protein L28